MIALIMTASLIGSVILTGVCAPLAPAAPPASPTPYVFAQEAPLHTSEDLSFIFPTIQGNFFLNAERAQGEHGMQRDTIRDQMRRGIVEKSVQILRSHGKSDDEIRSMILNDFRIEEKVHDEILSTDSRQNAVQNKSGKA